ncbi:MAG TPA: septal ring lytic transglycosylase RlpA family protein [Nitrospinota bacterium]|nr:septal ring lytic transglycosylase RlpA family protein [Nitrospinota bacterium]
MNIFKRYIFFIIPILLFLLSSCAPYREKIIIPVEGEKFEETGIASWYGEDFHGRKTANGETYNMYSVSAAHKTLSFGTLVNVRDLENGKTLLVRINDRGPFIRGRIIDLSYGAAKKLDMVEKGIAKVRITVVKWESPKTKKRGISRAGLNNYTVQVGSFTKRENAIKLKNQLEKSFRDVCIVVHDTNQYRFYRVRVGINLSKESALQLVKRFELDNFSPFVTAE